MDKRQALPKHEQGRSGQDQTCQSFAAGANSVGDEKKGLTALTHCSKISHALMWAKHFQSLDRSKDMDESEHDRAKSLKGAAEVDDETILHTMPPMDWAMNAPLDPRCGRDQYP